MATATAALHRIRGSSLIDAIGLARYTQAVLQGSFVLSKAADDPRLVLEGIEHLRRYLTYLFDPSQLSKEIRP